MTFLLEKLGDKRLETIADSISTGGSKEFKEIQVQFPEYDPRFLWLIAYTHEDSLDLQAYIKANYLKYYQILDSKFIKKLAREFESHLWEMFLCDILSSSGILVNKSEAGPDFLLQKGSLQIQIEAVAPEEAEDISLRSERPDYDLFDFFESTGLIHDRERPVLLRAIKGFDQKQSGYGTDLPLIIAINTSKTVGTISDDNYVLRLFLFGLGNVTITRLDTESYRTGFEQLSHISKPGQPPFEIGYFRNPAYSHVSGVIYTSQSARGLTPNGWGWSNRGITYVPNPLATHPIGFEFPFFHKLVCGNDVYQEIPATAKFVSTLNL